MRTLFNFTSATEAKRVEPNLKAMLKFVFAKMDQTRMETCDQFDSFWIITLLNTLFSEGRVRLNELWLVFYNSSWSFYKPYGSRKHVFHESCRVTRTQDYGLKTYK